jgi:adenosylcobyric acid synthase
VVLERRAARQDRRVRIAVPMLSRIANFDDFDPLHAEPQVDLGFIPPGQALPGDADLIILPGTKATLADLGFLRAQGWDIDLFAHVRRGGRVLGVCGGYQMLGRRITDPDGVEGPAGAADGLGLLDVETVLSGEKVLRPIGGRLSASGARFEGYEIHVGHTTGPALRRPLLTFDDGAGEGAVSPDGRVSGCYVHGLFNAGAARAALLADLGAPSTGEDQAAVVDRALDEIAAVLNQAFDIPAVAAIAGLEAPPNGPIR